MFGGREKKVRKFYAQRIDELLRSVGNYRPSADQLLGWHTAATKDAVHRATHRTYTTLRAVSSNPSALEKQLFDVLIARSGVEPRELSRAWWKREVARTTTRLSEIADQLERGEASNRVGEELAVLAEWLSMAEDNGVSEPHLEMARWQFERAEAAKRRS